MESASWSPFIAISISAVVSCGSGVWRSEGKGSGVEGHDHIKTVDKTRLAWSNDG